MTAPTQWEGPAAEGGPAPGVEFADPGSRLVAYIIDILIIVGSAIGLGVIAALIALFFWPLAVVIGLIIIVVPLVYFPYFWQKDGQTPGNKMMGIRVVRDKDGGPVTWGSAILRLIGYWISAAVFYIGYIWIFIDKRRRGWQDLIGGTVVIKAPVEDYVPEITRPTYGGHMGDPGDPSRLPD